MKRAGALKIFSALEKSQYAPHFGGINMVYDGFKNLYSPKPLPFGDSISLDINLDEGRDRNYKVLLKLVSKINMEETHQFLASKVGCSPNVLCCINALDLAFRMDSVLNKVSFGRSFYTPAGKTPLMRGLEIWNGLYQSCRPSPNRLLLNADVSHTAFYQAGSLAQLIPKYFGLDAREMANLGPRDFKIIAEFLKGVTLQTNHRDRPHVFKFNKFTKDGAKKTFFELDGKKISIFDHFRTKYNRNVIFPDHPCVVSENRGVFPLEVCEIFPNQRYMKKLDENQTADMIKITCVKPQEREAKIAKWVQDLNLDKNKYLKAFDVKVDKQLVQVSARILPTPILQFPGKTTTPNDGKWNMNGLNINKGTTLQSWGLICLSTPGSLNKAILGKFIEILASTCTKTGVKMSKNGVIEYLSPQGDTSKELVNFCKKHASKRFQMIFVVLPNTSSGIYGSVKFVTDTVVGLPSQCLQSRHIKKAQVQYCANVCLKINAKLGGYNFVIPSSQLSFVSQEPTIIFGADVTHSSKDDKSLSIATVVASMNSQVNKYACAIRTQDPRVETLVNLKEMTKELIEEFKLRVGSTPKKILFYRDGVSEGQFKMVLDKEVKAITQACVELDPKKIPKITFVVVQKRHHARFFPMDGRDADKSGNCKPGTVIDTEITHPFEFDFYLQSHAGLQGTSRSAHYQVIFDENKFTSDSLQDLTNKLCYIYARSTTSVSIVPPVYYAHLAAFRARFHAIGGASTSSKERVRGDYATVHKDIKHEMFFI